MNKFVKCPLNYTGGKYQLLSQLYPKFPKEGDLAIDLFCGGANVGVNLVNFKKIKCIDNNKQLVRMLTTFKEEKDLLLKIEDIIEKYNLSNSSKKGRDHYEIERNEGFSRINKESYLKLRKDYNKLEPSRKKSLLLIVLVIYGFNSQIRFNQKGEFNIPVGKSDLNPVRKKNIIEFSKRCKKLDIHFIAKNFKSLEKKEIKKADFVYCDPPYLISNATYNENGGWDKEDEKSLLKLLDYVDGSNTKFALSNILYSDREKNHILLNWVENYKVHELSYGYENSNYQKGGGGEKEVLITNY